MCLLSYQISPNLSCWETGARFVYQAIQWCPHPENVLFIGSLVVTLRHMIYLSSIFFWVLLVFQDILRLLTLWFNHGATAEVQKALQKGFALVNINTWLVVLPQIIARIHSNNHAVRELIQSLLVRIGQSHPQVVFHGSFILFSKNIIVLCYFCNVTNKNIFLYRSYSYFVLKMYS